MKYLTQASQIVSKVGYNRVDEIKEIINNSLRNKIKLSIDDNSIDWSTEQIKIEEIESGCCGKKLLITLSVYYEN